jgi:hypothetical protein
MSKKEWDNIYEQKCQDFNRLPSILPPVERIIVLGDLHGDWEMTIESLKIAKLINNKLNWVGGNTVVVQLGDQIDRCRFVGIPCNLPQATKDDEASDMKILNYFTKLHHQAQKKGGAVYSIIGNHELMNVNGDMRYVSFKNIIDFKNYKKPDGNIISDGMTARKWAFSPGNPIANFLGCTRQLSLIIGSNLFVHAGVLPKIAEKYNIEDMNQILFLYLKNKLKNPTEYKELLDSNDYSPIWNRIFGSIDKSKESCDLLMNPLKEIYKVGKIFIGHTPQLNQGITTTCEGKIWLTDYGASKAFDSFDNNLIINNKRNHLRNAQVLEILNDGKNINILKK